MRVIPAVCVGIGLFSSVAPTPSCVCGLIPCLPKCTEYCIFVGWPGNASVRDPARPDSVRDSGQRVRDGGAVASSDLSLGGHAEGQLAPRRRRVQVGTCARASWFAEPPQLTSTELPSRARSTGEKW